MAAPDVQIAGLENVFLPVFLQSFLSEICSRALRAIPCFLEDSSSNSMISCVHLPAETRQDDVDVKLPEERAMRRLASNSDEDNDPSEKCRVSIIDKITAPDRADRASRQQFSEWLLVAKNKDEEDEDNDEEDEDDEDEDDEEGDDEEGDDEEGGDAEGEEGDGDEDEEEDEADDDDEEEEEEDEDDEDDEEDESPPKKLRK